MRLDNRDTKLVQRLLEEWKAQGKISAEQANELQQDLETQKTTSPPVAQYFFLIAIACILLSFASLFIDEKLLEQIKQYFALSNIVIAIVSAATAGLWFWYLYKRRATFSPMAFEVYAVPGGLLSLVSLVYICHDFGFGPNYTGIFAGAAVVLMLQSLLLRSNSLWIGALTALTCWYGAFSEWQSYRGLYFKMNYPLRFVVFGAIIVCLAFLQRYFNRPAFSARVSWIGGFLILFTALWGLSIFGNFNSFAPWHVRQTQVIIYAIVFALAAIAAFIFGVKQHDNFTRDAAVAFLLLNLYTRYFEFLWDTMNKGIFFLILAVSFWFVGRLIEKRRNRLHSTSDSLKGEPPRA